MYLSCNCYSLDVVHTLHVSRTIKFAAVVLAFILYVCLCMLCQATRAKDVFQKHVDSVLAKGTKLRSLISDLTKNYPDDPTAKKRLI